MCVEVEVQFQKALGLERNQLKTIIIIIIIISRLES